jgi:hypothetical protein
MYPILEIDIDLKSAEKYLNELSRKQIPFATSKAMNNTMIDAQTEVRRTAFNNVFTKRNKTLPKMLTMIPRGFWASKHKLEVHMMNVRGAGAGFINRQIEGKVKVAKGSSIAIPVIGPGLRRLSGGAIGKGERPRANSKLFKNKAGTMLYERQRKKIVPRYVLTKKARPNKRGRFKYYEVGQRTIERNFETNWVREMNRAIRSIRSSKRI